MAVQGGYQPEGDGTAVPPQTGSGVKPTPSAERSLVELIGTLGESFEAIATSVTCPATKEFAAQCARTCRLAVAQSEAPLNAIEAMTTFRRRLYGARR